MTYKLPSSTSPFRPPSCAIGWRGLADYLGLIGIDLSPAALEKRGRVHHLPRRGGEIHGRTVWFLPEDMDQWTRHLTGLSLADCVREGDRAWQEGSLPQLRVRRHRRPQRTAARLPEWPLYALTAFRPPLGEQVHRDASGFAYAAVGPTVFEERCAAAQMPSTARGAWLHKGMRAARDTDLAAALRQGSGGRRQPKLLLGALEQDAGRLRWFDVPGSFFDLGPDARTRCLVVAGLPRMADLMEWVASNHPEAMWVIWPRRVEVDPFTLDEVQPRLVNFAPNLLD